MRRSFVAIPNFPLLNSGTNMYIYHDMVFSRAEGLAARALQVSHRHQVHSPLMILAVDWLSRLTDLELECVASFLTRSCMDSLASTARSVVSSWVSTRAMMMKDEGCCAAHHLCGMIGSSSFIIHYVLRLCFRPPRLGGPGSARTSARPPVSWPVATVSPTSCLTTAGRCQSDNINEPDY